MIERLFFCSSEIIIILDLLLFGGNNLVFNKCWIIEVKHEYEYELIFNIYNSTYE